MIFLFLFGSNYGGYFTHGFDTQNYPKLQASLGTQPQNTHGIQRQPVEIKVAKVRQSKSKATHLDSRVQFENAVLPKVYV